MEARERTELGPAGLILGGAGERELFAGEMHYWRVPRASWRACLEAAASLGVRIISTYVPWGVHEESRGALDFGGDRDLGAFLDLVAALGLHAIVRPGPHINAEQTCFGFPAWLVADEAVQARTARGTPMWMPAPPKMFPVPSYASARFLEETRRWYAAVGEIVAPRLYPAGPVVALQVDNEMQHFFRLGAYDGDYHPDALAHWADETGGLEPPRRWDPADQEPCLRWVAFKERSIERALAELGRGLDDAGLGGVARFHNAPPSDLRLTSVAALERAVGAAGMDFYHRRTDYHLVRERATYLAGTARLPFAPELGVGGPPWLPPMGAADQRQVTLGVLAGGVRAFNLFMLVDRDRWYGAAIDADGQLAEPAGFVRDLLAFLRQVKWTSLRRDAAVAVVVSRADARAAIASSRLDPLTPVAAELLGVGPGGFAELSADPAGARCRRAERAVLAALDLAEVPYAIVDEDALDRLPDVRAVIAPTARRIDARTWAALHLLADAGTQVVVGPDRPHLDELARELGDDDALPRGAGLIREASLDDVGGLAEDLLALAGDLGDDWIAPDSPDVHVTAFRDAGGAVRAVAVGNGSPEPCRARVALGRGARLADPLGGAPLDSGRDVAEIPLEGFEVRLFAVD